MRSKRSGQVLIVLALALTALTAVLALALDVGMAFVDARTLQNVVDAAALAGAPDIATVTTKNNPAYKPNKARMDAMVYLAKNLGIMGSVTSTSCGGVSLTPNYTTIPASYSKDIDQLDCTGVGLKSTGITLGVYRVQIHNPPITGPHGPQPGALPPLVQGDPYAIEVDITHNFPTSLSRVVGITQLPVTQTAVAGSITGRWTFLLLSHFSVGPTDLTYGSAQIDAVNGDIGDNAGIFGGVNAINWFACDVSGYDGGDPASAANSGGGSPPCGATNDQNVHQWYQAAVPPVWYQAPASAYIYNLYSYLQDPNFPEPWNGSSRPTSPDCLFQTGSTYIYASDYNAKTGVLTASKVSAPNVYVVPPGAYTSIGIPAGASGTYVLSPTPTPALMCSAAGVAATANSDKTPGYFYLGAPSQTQAALTVQATTIANGVVLDIQQPTAPQANSNAIKVASGAMFFLDGRSDLFGYTGPFCVYGSVRPDPTCVSAPFSQLVKASPWGVLGSSGGVAIGDAISIWVPYCAGQSSSSPGPGSHVVSFSSGSTFNVQGVIYAPDDNIGVGGNAGGNGVGKVVAYTFTLTSASGKVIEEFSSNVPNVLGLLD